MTERAGRLGIVAAALAAGVAAAGEANYQPFHVFASTAYRF